MNSIFLQTASDGGIFKNIGEWFRNTANDIGTGLAPDLGIFFVIGGIFFMLVSFVIHRVKKNDPQSVAWVPKPWVFFVITIIGSVLLSGINENNAIVTIAKNVWAWLMNAFGASVPTT